MSTVAANYWSRNVRFIYDGSTKRKTNVAIEDFDPRLKAVHLSDVKDLIGNPDRKRNRKGTIMSRIPIGKLYGDLGV